MSGIVHTPRYQPHELGFPLPESEHAVAVCLPTWKQNIGYEEQAPEVISKLQCGYPRFFLHPKVRELFAACEERYAGEGEHCFAFPSQRAAERCADFIRCHSGANASLHYFGSRGIWAVSFPADVRQWAMSYWQHSGEIISSRLAIAALKSDSDSNSSSTASVKPQLRERIAQLMQARAEDVYLFPTGMAAIYMSYRMIQKRSPVLPSVQFGFPYVDTLKIQQRCATSNSNTPHDCAESSRTSSEETVHFYPQGDADDLKRLESQLQQGPIMGLFCEIPGNPLLQTSDLQQLAELSQQHHFPLLVDDTIGAFLNVRTLPQVDAVTTSLTKFFSGRANVMGGALTLNPESPFYQEFKTILEEEYEDLLAEEDALVLELNSLDVTERVQRINQNAEQLCDALKAHPLVERVYYPKYETPELFQQVQNPAGGYGGLFSLLLKNAAVNGPQVFDALQVSKGPNFGSDFTICCPYTLLAHYQELDFVESCGISTYLIRVSVGLEDSQDLIKRFLTALDQISAE